MKRKISHADLLELKRWNTPTIYNGWEQITNCDISKEGFNIEPLVDFMPHMGPMIGYAITVVIEPGNSNHLKNKSNVWEEYRKYVASVPGPKIVVVQDLDKPQTFGAFWGEVNSNIHKALGCVGTITDGGIRDIDEMNNAGFKALAQRLCIGHAWSIPIKWNCKVTVFGREIFPEQLIHCDKHGFLIIPDEDQPQLLEAVHFMDSIECKTLIKTARNNWDKDIEVILNSLNNATSLFNNAVLKKYDKRGEWK